MRKITRQTTFRIDDSRAAYIEILFGQTTLAIIRPNGANAHAVIAEQSGDYIHVVKGGTSEQRIELAIEKALEALEAAE